jgi:hypothetical protein
MLLTQVFYLRDSMPAIFLPPCLPLSPVLLSSCPQAYYLPVLIPNILMSPGLPYSCPHVCYFRVPILTMGHSAPGLLSFSPRTSLSSSSPAYHPPVPRLTILLSSGSGQTESSEMSAFGPISQQCSLYSHRQASHSLPHII